MHNNPSIIKACIRSTHSRLDLWIKLIASFEIKTIAEIGVWQGDFAYGILTHCDSIEKYYFIDPWRHLSNWNKPTNVNNIRFQDIYDEAIKKTDFAAGKRVVLRGKTTEVIDSIPDSSLDFVYIDGDHTLRGIAIDLIRSYPKIKNGGFIGGDDFCKTIWQHDPKFEPSLVFPYSVYFAEAVGNRIYSLPYNQFLMEKSKSPQAKFSFEDLEGAYNTFALRDHVKVKNLLIKALEVRTHFLRYLIHRIKKRVFFSKN